MDNLVAIIVVSISDMCWDDSPRDSNSRDLRHLLAIDIRPGKTDWGSRENALEGSEMTKGFLEDDERIGSG